MLFRVVFGAVLIGVFVVTLMVVSCASAADASALTYILAHASRYAPPPCHADPCVLTGPGGIWQVWRAHVDRNTALGRSFVVTGICASSCERAARRVHARLLPGARLVYHEPATY